MKSQLRPGVSQCGFLSGHPATIAGFAGNWRSVAFRARSTRWCFATARCLPAGTSLGSPTRPAWRMPSPISMPERLSLPQADVAGSNELGAEFEPWEPKFRSDFNRPDRPNDLRMWLDDGALVEDCVVSLIAFLGGWGGRQLRAQDQRRGVEADR
jgi:hypothetical protein